MRRTSCLLTLVLIVGLASPGSADRLVTRQGEMIETKGPWRVKGKLVVFTTVSGQLSSMRLTLIDLEGSREATSRAAEPHSARVQKQATKRAKKEPVLVLTDSSLGRRADTLAQTQPAPASAALSVTSGSSPADESVASTDDADVAAIEEGFGEALDEMGQAMGEAMEQMGEAMAEGMAQGMEAMGEFMAVAVEIGQQAQALEGRYDLDTPQGMRAASGEMAEIARHTRTRAASAKPEVRAMLEELAAQLDELATLARENPEEAIRKREEGQASLGLE